MLVALDAIWCNVDDDGVGVVGSSIGIRRGGLVKERDIFSLVEVVELILDGWGLFVLLEYGMSELVVFNKVVAMRNEMVLI